MKLDNTAAILVRKDHRAYNFPLCPVFGIFEKGRIRIISRF
jgi:hypothetical protein